MEKPAAPIPGAAGFCLPKAGLCQFQFVELVEVGG
jgi:hypothetical protein